MDEQEIKILNAATAQFITYGIRGVTMDDVAREIAISKKTLYRYVSNKAELVDKCVNYIFNEIKQSLIEIQSKTSNAIDELFAFDAALTHMMHAQKPELFMQLRKYYPETFDALMTDRMNLVLTLQKHNLQKGVTQGIYRPEIQVAFIALMYYAQTVAFVENANAPTTICFKPEFVRENLIYHIRGIASEKGVAYLTQKLQEQ